MGTFPVLLTLRAGYSQVTGEFPSQRPIPRSFDVFFDLQLNKRLSKHSRRRWLDTPSCSSLRHYKPAHHSMPVLTIPWPCLHMRYGPFQFGSESNLCGELMLGTIVDEDEVGVVTVNGADIHGLRVLHPVLSRPATLQGVGRHQDMVTRKHFPHYWPFVRGIHRSPVDSPHTGPFMPSFYISCVVKLNKLLNN